MATFASRRCRGIFRAARAVMGFAFLFGATALNEAWVPGRISAARRSRESVARGDGAREESQELMDQLADDMDELMKLLQEGKTEGDDSSEDSNEDSSESDVDMVDGDVDDLEASPETSEAALVTVDTEAAQAISCLDVSGLRRVPGSANEYIVTTQQLQSIVNSKVQQFTAVIKGFEKYIEELEQELESTETELEEKDATLQVENERRQALEAELLTLKGRAEEMEQQLADAQQDRSGTRARVFLIVSLCLRLRSVYICATCICMHFFSLVDIFNMW
ncbi:unnamed protein product [Cladocopium goreaui]|uniref:NADPH:quinone oxidoreductase 1 n=1 Tax=Cladocopium goreaui TaxID=2562237 RepID=A0A9P1BUL9_9DINO|nr:unnamed protein product [Cladocopium goreaui]